MKKNKFIASWLNVWLYGLLLIGAALLIVLITGWTQFDWNVRLSILAIMGITLHVWEEERFPGGFTYMFNTLQKSQKLDRYPMNEFVAMAVDYSTIIVFIAILIFSKGAKWFGISLALFCCLETILHTAIGTLCLIKYRTKGKRTPYVPGATSAWFVFLPAAVGIFHYLVSNELISGKDWLFGIGVAVLVLGITVKGLEEILKDENSPYVVPEKYRIGYFRKFLKQ